MNYGRKEYTFFWLIENYSCCLQQNGESLVSPSFTVNELEGTTWELYLFPRGNYREVGNHISLFLKRRVESDRFGNIPLYYELSIIAADGSATCSKEYNYTFEIGDVHGDGKFLKRDEIFLQGRSDYLSQDILTVCCKMWKGTGRILHIGQSSARSRIKIEKDSFLHVVEKFSTLQINTKQTIKIPCHSKKGLFILNSLYFEGLEKIMIEIVLSHFDPVLCKCELFLLDRSGNVIKCGQSDNQCNSIRRNIHALSLSITRKEILNRKNEYLPGDKLSLLCECTFSSGIESQIF